MPVRRLLDTPEWRHVFQLVLLKAKSNTSLLLFA